MNTVSGDIFQEMDFFAASFLLGLILVAAYDCLRIFRQVLRHRNAWVSLEDLCYWIVAAFTVFAMLYQKNDGLIRGFSIGGIVLGMFLYDHFISRYTVPYIVRILKKVIHIVQKIYRFVLTPFRKAASVLSARKKAIKYKEQKIKKYMKKRLKKMKNEIKIGVTKK